MKKPDMAKTDEMTAGNEQNNAGKADADVQKIDTSLAQRKTAGKTALFRKFGKEDLKQLIPTTLITVSIIALGVSVPTFVVGRHTAAGALPKGQIEVEPVRPYAADKLEREMDFITAINEISWDPFYRDYCEIEYSVDASDRYSGIGIVSADQSSEFDTECFYDLCDLIYGTLGAEIPESWYGCDNDSQLIYLYTDPTVDAEYTSGYESNVLESSTGVPVEMTLTFRAPSSAIDGASVEDTLTQLYDDIVDIYNDRTGFDFPSEIPVVNDEGSGWDYYLSYWITNPDGLTLVIDISSGYYWTPPAYDGDTYHATEDFLWNVHIYLESNNYY